MIKTPGAIPFTKSTIPYLLRHPPSVFKEYFCGNDVTRVLNLGADASGGTSGILNAADCEKKIEEMLISIVEFRKQIIE